MIETLNIPLGKSTTVSFSSLATAGYSWHFEIGNVKIISVEPVENIKDISKMLIGASLDEIFKINGISIGSSTLIFSQSRSWEISSNPVQIKTFQVQVIG